MHSRPPFRSTPALPDPAASCVPSFVRHLPPTAVHKASAAEVLLTDAVQLDTHRFRVAARWPRTRFLHHGHGDAPDPLLLTETLRQALIHLSHRFYLVPQGHAFVMSSLGFDLAAPELPRPRGGQLPVVLDATCTPTSTSPRRFGMIIEADATIHGQPHGRLSMRWEVLTPRQYDLLRTRVSAQRAPKEPQRGAPGRLLPPERVGYQERRHVLLRETTAAGRDPGTPSEVAGEWWLHADRSHPVLYDHSSDHIPGMVLLEAFRQAVHAVGAVPDPGATSVFVTYDAFAEPERPVRITLHSRHGRPVGQVSLEAIATQDERQVASALFQGYGTPR